MKRVENIYLQKINIEEWFNEKEWKNITIVVEKSAK